MLHLFNRVVFIDHQSSLFSAHRADCLAEFDFGWSRCAGGRNLGKWNLDTTDFPFVLRIDFSWTIFGLLVFLRLEVRLWEVGFSSVGSKPGFYQVSMTILNAHFFINILFIFVLEIDSQF